MSLSLLRRAFDNMFPVLVSAVLLLTAGAAWAVDKITDYTVEGTLYKGIYDVHEARDGRIGIFYSLGGLKVERSKLSREFLESWGLSATAAPKPAATEAEHSNGDWLHAMQSQELDAAIGAGMIRRVGMAIYDLRKNPPGWESIANAKVVSIYPYGAVLEVPDRPEKSRFVVVANLPMVQNENETVTATVKLLGFEKRTLETLGEVTIACYDYGRLCTKEEVPLEILNAGVVQGAGTSWSAGQQRTSISAETRHARASGSGFFISTDGFLLTSYHVVAKAAKVTVRHGGQILTAEVKQVDRTNDLALLKVEGDGFKWLPLAVQPTVGLGENVFTIGYPNPGLQGLEPKYSEGTISGLDGFRDDPREYQMSVAVQPGNSGGPVCNAGGAVIGIVRAELNARYALLSSGALPQSVNYAVKSKYALQLLQSANLGRDFSGGQQSAAGASRDAIRERARDAAAMVLVY